MSERERVLSHYWDNVPAGMFILNPDGFWKEINLCLLETLGFDKHVLLLLRPVELIHPDDVKKFKSDLSLLVDGGVNFLKSEVRFRLFSGDYLWVLINLGVVKNEVSTILYFVGSINSIEPIKKRECLLRRERDELFMLSYDLYEIATKDSLTNMANRRQFMHWFGIEYENNKNCFRPFSLAVMDIDFFKEYNDTYGHHEGDIALKRISIEIMNILDSDTKIARFGGEEFIMLILNTDQRSGEDICEKIRCKIEGIAYLKRKITVSIGLVSLESRMKNKYDFDALYNIADKMLYVSKNAGRNVVRGVRLL
ncbi:diguanylate cyclase [Enterobacter ludwigii]|uniref:GGDEF domain-containing protein n=1 Tax=Enterobacter ludwigii TaxID=299767 RepID=UPI00159C9EA8|nr:GGDEF domain-containing protein [Enterobacter ludwigii]QLA06292.1 diguanylate cyclase [Enterobacter ludwigii]